MRKTTDESSVYREDLMDAVQRCTSDPHGLDVPLVHSGIRPLDELVGGLPAGDVTVLLGDSGAGKSALMRNMALAAADQHVFYVPQQDGTVTVAARKMLQAIAGIGREALDDGALSNADRVALLDAGEVIKRARLSAFCIDCLSRDNLNEAIEREWDSDYDTLADEHEGLILIDSIDLIDVAGASLREVVRYLKDIVCGSGVALVVTVAGGSEALNDVCSAGLVIQASEASGADPFACDLRVLKDAYGPAAGNAIVTVHFDEALAVVPEERRAW